jgi:DNA-binding beta-propeller fold protein YncE
VWVPNRRRARLSRIAPASGERKSTAIGLGQHRAVFGAGSVWVTNFDDGTVTENTRALDNAATIPVDVRGPLGIAYSSGTVWVASNLDNKVIRIDAAKGTVVGDPIDVGRNPFAITAHGKSAWVTNLADGTVTRIDLR